MSKMLGLATDSEIDNAIEEPDMLFEPRPIVSEADDMGVVLSEIEDDEFAIF